MTRIREILKPYKLGLDRLPNYKLDLWEADGVSIHLRTIDVNGFPHRAWIPDNTSKEFQLREIKVMINRVVAINEKIYVQNYVANP